jgi:hypothetical protein
MYRIEVKPGEETVFRTIEELATGIRNGFITPRARIYHAASQKWLPIEFHPHYKRALDGNFTPSSTPAQPSLAAKPAPTFSFPGAVSAPTGPAAAEEAPAAPMPEPPAVRVNLAAPPRVPASSSEAEHPAPSSTVAESPVLAMRATVHRTARRETEPEPGPVERYSPVTVLEPPRPTPAPARTPAPPAEVVLPNITYPELPALEHAEPRAPARRSRRTAGRPLLLVGSAALLVFAGQRFLASRAAPSPVPSPAGALATPAEPARAEIPEPPSPPEPASPSPSSARPAPQTAAPRPEPREPLVPPPSRPMTPGPAFAASVPARIAPGSPLPGSAPEPTASAPARPWRPAPPADSAAIAPAPAAIQLDLPALLPGDSIAPALDDGRDSLAIKRILKAVSGRKASPASP